MSYSFRLGEIYETQCGETPAGGRERDRYYQTLKGFDVIHHLSRVTFLHFALPQSYEQFLISRGCPDGSRRAIRQREVVAGYMDLARQIQPSDSDLGLHVRRIIDAVRAQSFAIEDEGALLKIREMMRWNDPFFVLVGVRLLNLISWENDELALPPEFAVSVGAIAAYTGSLIPYFMFDKTKLIIWTVVEVLEDLKKGMPPASSSAAPSVPPVPSVPPAAAVPAEGAQGASAASWFGEDEVITDADSTDFGVVEWAEDDEPDFGYEADASDWEGLEAGENYYYFGEMGTAERFAPDLIP